MSSKPKKRSKTSLLIESFEDMSLEELRVLCQNRQLPYDENESQNDLHDRLVSSYVSIKPASLKRWQKKHGVL